MNSRLRVLAGVSLAIAVSLSVVSLKLTASTGAGTTSPTPAKLLQRFAPTYMTPGTAYTQAQAVAMATEFDLITAHGAQFKPYVSAMKAANPKLVIVGYVHGAFDHSAQGTTYPSTWYAHDATGNRIQSSRFGDWLLDMSNVSWAASVGTQCSKLIAANGYDGCFVDELGWGVLSTNYLTSMPIDPRTGVVWTNSDWLTASAAIAAQVDALNPGSATTGNGLDTGGRYYDATAPTSRLLPPLSGGMAEVWLRVARSSITQYRSLKQWKQSVDMLADAGSRGGSVLAITKLWTTATAAQQQSWHKYSLASFLLGTDGHSYYSFLADSSAAAITADYAWDHVDVGTPQGPYALLDGAYQRNFSNGRALVNPTTATVTVSLGGSYRDLDGNVVASVTLGPNSGEVVVNAAQAQQTPLPSSSPTPTVAPTPTATPTPTPTPAPTATPTAAPTATPSPPAAVPPHVMVIVEENHEYNNIIGSSQAPYINSLAQTYGLATNWYAVTHPSLPNYLALTSGSTQGATTDATSYVFNADNLANQLAGAGFSWKGYMEGMPSPCFNGGSFGEYAKKHNPFMYYSDILGNAAQCNRVVPFSQFAGDLAGNTMPDFAWITPNLLDDMHDGTVAQGDAWLAATLQPVLASSWYRSGGIIIITWDEGGTDLGLNGAAGGGHIATIVVSATSHGQFSSGGNHYGTLRAIEETYGVGLLANSGTTAGGDLRGLL